jgi:hypothetical protein
MRENAAYQPGEEFNLPEDKDFAVLKDEKIALEYKVNNQKFYLTQRRIAYWNDQMKNCLFS